MRGSITTINILRRRPLSIIPFEVPPPSSTYLGESPTSLSISTEKRQPSTTTTLRLVQARIPPLQDSQGKHTSARLLHLPIEHPQSPREKQPWRRRSHWSLRNLLAFISSCHLSQKGKINICHLWVEITLYHLSIFHLSSWTNHWGLDQSWVLLTYCHVVKSLKFIFSNLSTLYITASSPPWSTFSRIHF